MKKILLPAMLTSLMLQFSPAFAATSATASFEWDSLNIQLIDLSEGTDVPVLTWTNIYSKNYASAYTAYPQDSQASESVHFDDPSFILSDSATTSYAQSTTWQDASTLSASSATQVGTVPMSWGYNYQNISLASSFFFGEFTLTGNGIALITMDWSVEAQGVANDWNDSSYVYAYLSGEYYENQDNYSVSYYGIEPQIFTGDSGSVAYHGTFAMDVVNTSPNGTFGSITAESYAYSSSPNAPVPVPEPETYAMMLAGLGLVGLMASRRKD